MYTACGLGRWFRHLEYMAGVMSSHPEPHPLMVSHLGQSIGALQAAASAYLREVPSATDVEIMLRRCGFLIDNFNLHESVNVSDRVFDIDMVNYSPAADPLVTFAELSRWMDHLVHMLGRLAVMENLGGVAHIRRLRAYLSSSAQMLVREIEAFRLPVPVCPMKYHDLQAMHGQALSVTNLLSVARLI